jgi:ferredoxin
MKRILRSAISFVLLVCVTVSIFGCSAVGAEDLMDGVTARSVEPPLSLDGGNAAYVDFALRLFLASEGAGEGNVIISPLSVMCALAMTANGAKGDTLVEMEDLAKERNFTVIGAVAAIAQHSIVNDFGAGRPDSSDAAKLKGFAQKILAKIESGDMSKPHVPGKRPYKKAMGKLGLVPHATKGCLYCGVCAKKCPVQAIDIDKIFGASRRKCISCMRCVANCSTDVRKLNALELKIVETKIKKEASSRKEPELFL